LGTGFHGLHVIMGLLAGVGLWRFPESLSFYRKSSPRFCAVFYHFLLTPICRHCLFVLFISIYCGGHNCLHFSDVINKGVLLYKLETKTREMTLNFLTAQSDYDAAIAKETNGRTTQQGFGDNNDPCWRCKEEVTARALPGCER